MDIQTRKIKFIQEFLKIQNEEMISQLEEILLVNKSPQNKDSSPMTMVELEERIDKSMDDSKNEKITPAIELEKEIEKWK